LTAAERETVLWGDCNPKNIVMNGDDACFIDPHPKRGSRFLDLVLLFTFADAPRTYVARCETLEHLDAYWRVVSAETPCKVDGLDQFRANYDAELLWRLLVFGGALLAGGDARLQCWEAVCRKMQPDLLQLCAEQGK
jgi:hypothetical protein